MNTPNGAAAEAVSKGRAEEKLKAFHEEAGFGKAYDRRLLIKLWPYVRPHQRLLWLAVLVILLSAVGGLAKPLIMKHALDEGVLVGDEGVLMAAGFGLAAIAIIEQVLLFIQTYAVQIVGARSMASLRSATFRFLHELRQGFFDTQPVGRLVTRVTNDVDAIQELFASGAINAVGDLVRLVGIVVLMVMLDPKLSLVAFAATPLVGLMVVFVRRRLRESFREIRAKTAQMNANMSEQVNGMAVVQAFTQKDAAAREFDQINVRYRDANMKAIKFEAMQDAAIEMVAAVCLASIIAALGYHSVSFGTIVAFNAYLLMFFEPISALAQRYVLLQSAMTGAERVFSLLEVDAPDAPKRTPEEASATVPVGDSPAFVFQDVVFGYKPERPVLRGVSISAKRGEKLALVGPTGSGKTTIASLLLRLYDIQEGSIRVQGRDVRDFSREELRACFSVVPQDVYLFPGSIASNVAAGEPDLAKVERVLRKLKAWDLLACRPGGLLARVEERASNFSGGERQLIAFARALYRDAPIVILDEATASVDSDTEARLKEAVEELLKDRTALIIAHRLSTIREADRIVVFQAGRVAESGSHEELLRHGGLYARLHSLQFAKAHVPHAGGAAAAPQG
ncbi:MAG: ABC transporter ATP-binding protein [Polyangiaceae bacterium]|nr:ABC transporter ATP-binding protein [Polyangiaceae bacterium]